MKILCISDTHSLHLEWEKKFPINYSDIDLIIHAGDLTNIGSESEFNHFIFWFKNLPSKYKVMIAGNHDLGLDNSFKKYNILDMIRGTKIHYLEDSGVTIEGINIWGSPVSLPFMDWAFMREPNKIVKHWEAIPHDTNILVTHTPPYNILDFVNRDNLHVGCQELSKVIKKIKPQLSVFGHIHDMRGIEFDDETMYINASIVDEYYIPTNKPYIIDFNIENKIIKVLES